MVVSIIALVTGILVPAVGKARQQARRILCMSNQRSIVQAANLYAADGDGRFPESVATVGRSGSWNWQEPMKLVGFNTRSPRVNRSMSAYLRAYLSEGKTVYCASSRRRFKYLDEAWAAGDDWDNPDTPMSTDPLTGTYCFYWSYTGYLESDGGFFQGPRTDVGGRGRSKLLVSDYFGYDFYESTNAYGSSEKFKGATLVRDTTQFSGYWAGKSFSTSAKPEIKLTAGYVDGHVENYSSLDTISMLVIKDRETGEPYPDGIGPGKFYLPKTALH